MSRYIFMINDHVFRWSDVTTVNTMRYLTKRKYVSDRMNMSNMTTRKHMSDVSSWNKLNTMNTVNTGEHMSNRKYVNRWKRNRNVNKRELSPTKICMMMTNEFNFISSNYMTTRYTVNKLSAMSDVSIVICCSNKYSADMIMMNKRTVCKHRECDRFLC